MILLSNVSQSIQMSKLWVFVSCQNCVLPPTLASYLTLIFRPNFCVLLLICQAEAIPASNCRGQYLGTNIRNGLKITTAGYPMSYKLGPRYLVRFQIWDQFWIPQPKIHGTSILDFFEKSKNKLVRPKMAFWAILAEIPSFFDNSNI